MRPRFLPPDMIERWRGLQRREIAWDSPFLSPAWSRAVERAFDGIDRGLRVLVLHEAGRPQGFMAVRKGRVTAVPAGAPMAGSEGMVVAADIEPDPIQMVRKLGVQRLDFGHMPEASAGFAHFAKGRVASRAIDLSGGYKTYAAQHNAAACLLKDIGARRRLAEREQGPVVFTAGSTSKADLERLIELQREAARARGETDVFAADWPERLVKNLLGASEPGFAALFFTLHIGGRLAAAQFALAGTRTLHLWLAAHAATFERLSPDLVLLQQILRWMDKSPYDRLVLGSGDAPFKAALATEETSLMHGYVGLASTASLMREAAWRVRRAAEALPLGRISLMPGEAMRQADLIRALR